MYSQFRRFGILFLFLATACLGSPKTDAWNVLNEGLNGSAARRVQALSALGLLGQDEQAAHLARQAMRNKDPEVRQSAIAALGEMQCRDAIPQLKLALDDGNEQVGLAAAKALANMGDMSGRDIFKRLLTGEMKQGPSLVQTAMNTARAKMRDPGAMARVGIRGASVAASTPFIGPAGIGIWLVENALKDKGVESRVTALSYLADDPNPYAQTLLEWALADSSPLVRGAAVKGLAGRNDAAAIPKLQPLLKDGNAEVRFLAAAAIVRLSDRQPLPS